MFLAAAKVKVKRINTEFKLNSNLHDKQYNDYVLAVLKVNEKKHKNDKKILNKTHSSASLNNKWYKNIGSLDTFTDGGGIFGEGG